MQMLGSHLLHCPCTEHLVTLLCPYEFVERFSKGLIRGDMCQASSLSIILGMISNKKRAIDSLFHPEIIALYSL
jgi:hypothetical protein